MTAPHEVFDTNYDYYYASAERMRKPAADEPRLLGRVARLLFEEKSIDNIKAGFNAVRDWWKRERAAFKAERAYRGSLESVGLRPEPEHNPGLPQREPGATLTGDLEPPKLPQPDEPGVYYSEHAAATRELPDDEAFMEESAKRARERLGQLPVAHVLGEQPNPEDPAAEAEQELPLRTPADAIAKNPVPAQRTSTEDEDLEQNARSLDTPEIRAVFASLPGRHRTPKQTGQHRKWEPGKHRASSRHPFPYRLLRSRKPNGNHETASK